MFPYFSTETDLIRESITEFCMTEIKPHAELWDDQGMFPQQLFVKAGRIGLFGIRFAEDIGGSGLDWWSSTAAIEALAEAESGSVATAFLVQSDVATPIVAELGSPEQIQSFLVPAISGQAIAALAVSEPNCGSDVAAITCTAQKDGDDYVINGQKLWITNGTRADWLTLAVRTGGDGYKGLSLVTFPTDVKGFRVGRKLGKVGHLASDTAELFFDRCRIPKRYLLGQEHKGFYYIMDNFQSERLGVAILAVAMMKKIVREAKAYGVDRKTFGKSLNSFQVWKHKFADMETAIEAARWLTYRAVDLYNRKEAAVREITMAKLFATDLAQRVAYECMQFYGGFGYSTEYAIGRAWRDLRLFTVGGGSSEIMKEILARQ